MRCYLSDQDSSTKPSNGMTTGDNYFHPRYWPTWAGLGLLSIVVRLPHRWRIAIGSALGSAGYYLAGSRRRIVETNLALCFPHLSAAERSKLAKDTFRSGGMSIVETAIAWLVGGSTVMDRAVIEGLEHLNRAREKGKGVILLGTHMATLDLAGAIISPSVTVDLMYRANKNKLMEHIMTTGRERLHATAIERNDVRQLIRNLKAGHVVWYGPDQDYGPRNSVFVPFFGVAAATTTAPSRIAKMTGASIIPFTHYRVDNNSRYRVLMFPPMEHFPSGSFEDDARRINEFVESCIRRYPDQYWWFHRRFKSRPPGEPPVY